VFAVVVCSRPTVRHIKAIGMKYTAEYAICFETRYFPDSPNHPNFPSTEITASHPLHEVTLLRFRAE